jgi:hypothetical protein
MDHSDCQEKNHFLKNGLFTAGPFMERGTPGARCQTNLLLKRRSKMDKRDQELLAKQLWLVSSPPQNGGIVGLMIVAAFLIGIGIGDILSESKRANTNYAAMVSRIAEAPP